MAKRTSTKKKDKNGSTDNTENIILPDVRDIPGQENIVDAGVPGEMADTTISSDDEEGIRDGQDILEEADDTEIVMGTEADVTKEDLAILGDRDHDMDQGEDEMVLKQGLDDTDTDGDPLNEGASDDDTTGDDLDVPEDENDQEEEENKYYSLGSDDNDKLNEGTP